MAKKLKKYDISLRIHHPDMDVREMVRHIGWEPHNYWTAGERRRTPSGRRLDHIADSSFAVFHFEYEGEELGEEIIIQTYALAKHAEFFNRITDSGGTVEFFIGWYIVGNVGLTLDTELISRLNALRIQLAFDVYDSTLLQS